MKGCKVPGCPNVHKGLGYCNTHYHRSRARQLITSPCYCDKCLGLRVKGCFVVREENAGRSPDVTKIRDRGDDAMAEVRAERELAWSNS